MLGNEGQASVKVEALRSNSYSAGANNGPWLPVADYQGDLVFAINTGPLTGSVVYKLQDATSSGGVGAADLSPAVTTASISTPGATSALTVNKSACRSHVRLVATVTTGPAQAAGILLSRAANVL